MSWPRPEDVARALGGAKQSGDGWMAKCPAHDDQTPSLSIKSSSDGKLLVHCFAGCESSLIVERLKEKGLWWQSYEPTDPHRTKTTENWRIVSPVPPEITPPRFEHLCGVAPELVHEYRNADAQLIGYQCRIAMGGEKKIFLPITCWSDGASNYQWRKAAFPEPRPLYGLDELARRPSDTVLIVEGEKTADAARGLLTHLCVVTWPYGANSVAKVDWSPLQGRSVVIWPDNDTPGLNAALQIAANLDQVRARSVRLVRPPDSLPVSWDLADTIPAGLGVADLIENAKSIDDSYAPFIISAQELGKLNILPREYIVVPFLPERGLAMIYAPRGVGKTWIALCLALAVALGRDFLAYDVPGRCSVLYVDGEMSLGELRERLLHFAKELPRNLFILSSETLAMAQQPLNLNVPEHQKRFEKTLSQLERLGHSRPLIILDNLSSLGGGIDENDNSALDAQLQWLLRLRHSGYAVVLIHHAGKSGDQRGASRREDFLDTSIKLELPKEDENIDIRDGATFYLTFVKTRGKTPVPDKLLLSLREGPSGQLEFQFARASVVTPRLKTLRAISEGVTTSSGILRPYQTQNELAQKLKVTKSTVSKHLTVLRDQNLVTDQPSGIVLTAHGAIVVGELFNAEVAPLLIEDKDAQDKVPF